MKKTLIYSLLFCLTALAGNVRGQVPDEPQAEGQQAEQRKEMTALERYQRDMTTTPYKVKHSVKKQRRVETRKGTRQLKHNNLSNSVNHFRLALGADSMYHKAQYNRAIAHGQLQQLDTALAYYQRCVDNPAAKPEVRAKAYYNAGNIMLRHALAARDTGGYDHQSLVVAINQYQASLRIDPKNSDAQHNLSIAKQLLRPESQQSNGGGGGQNDQNQQQQQDQQNKDQQNQDQNKDNQDQQKDQQNKDNQNQQDQQQQQQKQQQPQGTREAEQMLNALKNNEQQTIKRLQQEEAKRDKRKGLGIGRPEKDW
ncbi:MAG: hypothetical protein K5864_08945 [Bacteroidales bacterium]|nr:hypothetical protein [Bacteroidales bacterium]